MSYVVARFLTFAERVRAAWVILWFGCVHLPEVQITYSRLPTVRELCGLLHTVMCSPDTDEEHRRIVASTLAQIAFPERRVRATRGN